MKKIKNTLKYAMLLFVGATVMSCSEDETVSSPTAAFTIDESTERETGYAITFTSESSDAFSYIWSFGDGKTAIGKSAVHRYTNPGTYEVTLEASGNGKRDLASETITIAPNNSELYFIDNDAAKMRKMAIGDTSTLIDVFDLPGFCIGMAYNDASEELYYSDDDALSVFKNSINGGAEVALATNLSNPRDLAVDAENNLLYFTERSADQITKLDLADNTTSTMYSIADDPDFLLPVGLDLYDGNLYATAVEIDAETVWVGGVDGSGIARIIDYDAGGFGYGIEIDEVNERIYFDNNDGSVLNSANLDGTDLQSVGATSDRVYGIAIFHEIDKVFWANEDGTVFCSNLDGTSVKEFVDLEGDIRGLVLRKVN